jgi:hypothetical protein
MLLEEFAKAKCEQTVQQTVQRKVQQKMPQSIGMGTCQLGIEKGTVGRVYYVAIAFQPFAQAGTVRPAPCRSPNV